MKFIYKLTILVFALFAFSCNQNDSVKNNMEYNQRRPLGSLEEARNYVSEDFNEADETLWISDSLNDSVGINMAILLDDILNAGYSPNGFEQKEGFRIYKYKKE